MASSSKNAAAPNLATLLAVKQKMNGNKPNGTNEKQPVVVTGAHSKDKILYRPDVQPLEQAAPVKSITPNQPKTTTPSEPTEPNKIGRKTKQLEVALLDKKMEEIQRKQEQKTNEALDSWKGFENMNYGFYSNGMPQKAAPTPVKQAEPQPIPEKKTEEKHLVREPSPPKPNPKSIERVEEPPKPRSEPKEPVREPSPPPVRKETPKPRQKPRELSPSPSPPVLPPTPPPRRSKSTSQPLSREKTIEREPVPLPFQSTITPIPMLRRDPKPIPKEPVTFLGSTWNPVSNHRFRIFPDIKPHQEVHSRNAGKSIQRSMDRYRFHVW